MKIYQAINAVQSDLAHQGISKDRTNSSQGSGYKFRGIDDVYNAISPLLAKHGLCILPRMVSRSVTERQTAKGSAIFYTTIEAEFDFVSAEDGSKHTVRTFGEAMDMSDKSTNKAMSAAYKYACLQAFAIPTEGDNDADEQTHQVQAGLPESVIADYCEAMKNSLVLDNLKSNFGNAYTAAQTAGDSDAAATFKKIYDAKKAEMLGGQA
jgi:hypothetical protein